MIAIVGANGSMGKRYQAILKFLGKPFIALDVENRLVQVREIVEKCEGVIIATPTNTHYTIVSALCDLRKPMLCEKPIVKNLKDLDSLFDRVKSYKAPFKMMCQYKLLTDKSRIGPSSYNYFKTGNDGLAWDCMQVIGLARSGVSVANDSPIWSCKINGKLLDIKHMDAAYIGFVQDWFLEPKDDFGFLRDMHARTSEFAAGMI